MRVLHSRVSHGSLGVSRLEGSRGRVIRCVLAEFAHVHTWSNLIFQNYDDSYGLSTRDQEVQWYLFNTLECSNFDVLGIVGTAIQMSNHHKFSNYTAYLS